MEHITETAITDQEAQIIADLDKLNKPERVLFVEILKVLAAGDNMESTFIHQPHDYKQILATMDCGYVIDAFPLMRYIQAKGEGWGELFTLSLAYRIGQADGKRQDRARRATRKKVLA